MFGHAERHCGGRAQRFVHAAEIVVRDVEADGSATVSDLFAEPVRQAREATGCHPNGQVSALDVTGADFVGLNPAGGDGDDPKIDPIIAGLLKRLPAPGSDWPEAERAIWVDLLKNSFKLIFKDASKQK